MISIIPKWMCVIGAIVLRTASSSETGKQTLQGKINGSKYIKIGS